MRFSLVLPIASLFTWLAITTSVGAQYYEPCHQTTIEQSRDTLVGHLTLYADDVEAQTYTTTINGGAVNAFWSFGSKIWTLHGNQLATDQRWYKLVFKKDDARAWYIGSPGKCDGLEGEGGGFSSDGIDQIAVYLHK